MAAYRPQIASLRPLKYCVLWPQLCLVPSGRKIMLLYYVPAGTMVTVRITALAVRVYPPPFVASIKTLADYDVTQRWPRPIADK